MCYVSSVENDVNDKSDQEERDKGPYAKAEAVFRHAGSLRGVSIRTGRLSGWQRLSMGEDCEDSMASFKRLESAKRLLANEE